MVCCVELRRVRSSLMRRRGVSPWADEKRSVLANFVLEESAFSVARRFCDGDRWVGPPCPGLMKSGRCGRNSKSTIRRYLLRESIVMAAAGTASLLAQGWSTSKSKSRSRSGAVERLSVRGRRNAPPLALLLKGGKLRATSAAGNLRSLFCKFSTGQHHPPRSGLVQLQADAGPATCRSLLHWVGDMTLFETSISRVAGFHDKKQRRVNLQSVLTVGGIP